LPEEEVTDPHLAARPYEEVRVGAPSVYRHPWNISSVISSGESVPSAALIASTLAGL
jgi:hypothetical protein